jgi:hypothetical protein
MALFMDIHHKVEGATAKDVADAHMRDVQTQGRYDVSYRNYWFNEATGRIFCLVEAPDQDAAIRVHREAHGLVADEILPVVQG